ncbi:MAG: aminotransferase class III-fold pyridoxal phosphate-dependent enzyme [Bacteroidales bacterium]|nr:MAG: aminotransferase class III-fold pyridoxal phosphate-dependent enzyme [Bacteroidales bacterium]
MKTFDVYPLYQVEPVMGIGCKLWDTNGTEYLDLYGGHAVISIGHSHPRYIKAIEKQLKSIGFYSNSVLNSQQDKLAELLGNASGYPDYSLFMCNSGAEANENALKLASFHNKKAKVLAFNGSFHGRTSGAVACTDNPSIIAPFNANHSIEFIPWNDINSIKSSILKGNISAVIIEGIQGVGGINVPDKAFMQELAEICKANDVILILDEVQSGYGRTGKFFAHQHFGIQPDIITIAKGMGNGFPVGGLLISPMFKPKHGLLGTTFGGNHLACAASIAVLETIVNENLVENANRMGQYLVQKVKELKGVKEIRGLGLMIGIEFDFPISNLRKKLLFDEKIFTGYSGTNTLRLLPPLCIKEREIDQFIYSMNQVLKME